MKELNVMRIFDFVIILIVTKPYIRSIRSCVEAGLVSKKFSQIACATGCPSGHNYFYKALQCKQDTICTVVFLATENASIYSYVGGDTTSTKILEVGVFFRKKVCY